MTRGSQQKIETDVIESFLKHLKKDGFKIRYEPQKTEAPDFRLFIEDRVVGCELTRITLEELEQWARGHSDRTATLEEEILGNRVEEWIEELLLRKIEKIPRYRKNCRCDELWLVVHFGIIPLFDHALENFKKMQKTIESIPHDFDKIWFVGESSDVRLLWPLK